MARVRQQLVLGVLCALALACACSAQAGAASSIALGVNIDRAPDDPAQLSAYVHTAGRAPAIVMWYQSWSEPLLYAQQMPPVDAIGSEPLITWSPSLAQGGVPLADIAGGSWDGYIRSQARLARGYGKPMMIRLAHEMNLPGDAYGPGVNGNTPELFVAAWRHVVTIFRDEGARNVSWVWSPNVHCDGTCPFADFYPGDAWTDWVALDGYNYGSSDDMPWRSLADVFKPSYDIITRISSKPVMIAETSSTEDGGDKASWIRQGLLRDVPALMPRVRALVWFDRVKETDWRVNSSARTLSAWRDVVNSPLYGGPTASAGLHMAGTARAGAHRRPRLLSCRASVRAHAGRKLSRRQRKHRVARCRHRRAAAERALAAQRRPLQAIGGASALRFAL